MFGSFFEQDYLSNLIILGFMQKDDQMFTYFKIETDVTQNLMDDFFLFWLSEDLSIGRILSEKKHGVQC